MATPTHEHITHVPAPTTETHAVAHTPRHTSHRTHNTQNTKHTQHTHNTHHTKTTHNTPHTNNTHNTHNTHNTQSAVSYLVCVSNAGQVLLQAATGAVCHYQTHKPIQRIRHNPVHHQHIPVRTLQQLLQQASLIVNGTNVEAARSVCLHGDIRLTALPPRQGHLTEAALAKNLLCTQVA